MRGRWIAFFVQATVANILASSPACLRRGMVDIGADFG
jgi:hypothetical protein